MRYKGNFFVTKQLKIALICYMVLIIRHPKYPHWTGSLGKGRGRREENQGYKKAFKSSQLTPGGLWNALFLDLNHSDG